MKTKNILLGMLLGVAGLTSCESWFDISPKTDMKADELFQNEDGFRDVLTGAYALMSTEHAYGKELTFGFTDVLARYYNQERINNESHEYCKSFQYLYKEPKEKEIAENIWFTQYKAISNLNTILERIDKSKQAFNTETIWRIYKGEALALRGFMHFDLLRLFAPSPKTDMETKAIPYMEELTNVAPIRSTVKEVLEKVIRDLNEAKELMRDVDSYGPNYADLNELYKNDKQLRNRKYHLNYYAITALLSRVHLYAGNTAEALKAAQEIIGQPGDKPVSPFELEKTFDQSAPLSNNEILFGLEMPQLVNVIDPYFGAEASDLGMLTSDEVLACSADKLEALFETENPADNDFRKIAWFGATSDPKYSIPSKLIHQELMPLIKISELYFIAAECTGGEQGLAYLNQLRKHRGLSDLTLTENLQKEIYKEYCKEFLNEGQMFYYYKRNNLSNIGVLETISIDPKEVYSIPLPTDEQDYGNNN